MMDVITLWCEDCRTNVEVVDIGWDRWEPHDTPDVVHVTEDHDLSNPNWRDDDERDR